MPDQRYLKLGGGLLGLGEAERNAIAKSLAADVTRITDSELSVLLDGGWRERETAAWLVAVAGLVSFRDRIGELLLKSEVCYAAVAYCIALATFGTRTDAELLCAYLERYLPRRDLAYDQAAAMGALIYLDDEAATHHADRFLGPGGLWESWLGGQRARGIDSARDYARNLAQLCAFAVAARSHIRRRSLKDTDVEQEDANEGQANQVAETDG